MSLIAASSLSLVCCSRPSPLHFSPKLFLSLSLSKKLIWCGSYLPSQGVVTNDSSAFSLHQIQLSGERANWVLVVALSVLGGAAGGSN